MKRRGGLGWVPSFASRGVESAEDRFWRGIDLGGQVVYDVGAFHGLLTLFFARHARTVVAYEPNSWNYNRLLGNIQANTLSNVVLRQVAVGSSAGEASMVFSSLTPGGGSIDPDVGNRIRAAEERSSTEHVQVTTIDADIADHGLPATLIKIDIEGFELEALLGARQTLTAHHPALFLELHGSAMNEKRRKVRELVEHLESMGYADIRHVESGGPVTAANCESSPEGHLYCVFRRVPESSGQDRSAAQ